MPHTTSSAPTPSRPREGEGAPLHRLTPSPSLGREGGGGGSPKAHTSSVQAEPAEAPLLLSPSGGERRSSGAPPFPRLTLTLLAAAALILAACGDDEAAPTPSPTPTATPTATATATAVSAETLDFTAPAVIGPLIDHFGGGEVPLERIEYIDFTGDGVDEALVVVESGGTQGDLGAAVLRVADGQPDVLGYIEAGGRIETRLTEAQGGVIASLEGVYEPADPECCPSKLRERVYQWDGERFVLTIDQIIANDEEG